MLNIEQVAYQDRWLRALTRLNIQAFVQLLIPFYEAYIKAEQNKFKPRKRSRGGGHKARLKAMDVKLLFILFYFKCYPTFDLLGILFDVDRLTGCQPRG